MKRRSGFAVMARFIGLVRPLTGTMVLAIAMGLVGHLCAAFITIFGGYAVLDVLGIEAPLGLTALFAGIVVMAVLRAGLRYAEQACNHFIAFKLLALIRDRVFCALRRLCPAKLEGRDRGNRVLDILDETPVVEEITGRADVAFTGAAAENVSFAYEDKTILDHVSVTIPENRIVGITGRSGSGKSTLLKLFMRFWTPQAGEVRVSGRSVNDINTANLRDLESFVTQETHLFHDSIKNNLRIAKLDASDGEIVAACKKASVHDFIMTLPCGYDTPVGELGDTLSGGERQRLRLARAFLYDAPLMLLDEPTSNLDSLNEAVILRSLREEGLGKTVVLVSHRASTMRIADEVYAVERGRMS